MGPTADHEPDTAVGHPRIAIVGVSGAGKSTLVAALRGLGWDAHDCAQEHSEVRHMWQAMTHPDLLIYLDASLETIRQRRQVNWEEEVIRKERERLEHARQHADLYLMTDGLSVDEMLKKVVEFLGTRSKQTHHRMSS